MDNRSEKSLLSQISVFETGDNYIGLNDKEKLYCYSLPQGKLIGMEDAKLQGPEEFQNPDNRPIHELKDGKILLTGLSVFIDNLYARVEWKNEIYYFVYDILTDDI